MSRHEKWYSAGPHWLCCDTGARWHGPMSAPGYWHQEIPAEIGTESVLTEECRETGAGWPLASDWSDWQQGRLLIGPKMQAGLPRSSLLEGWHCNGLTGYKENKKCCLPPIGHKGTMQTSDWPRHDLIVWKMWQVLTHVPGGIVTCLEQQRT